MGSKTIAETIARARLKDSLRKHPRFDEQISPVLGVRYRGEVERLTEIGREMNEYRSGRLRRVWEWIVGCL